MSANIPVGKLKFSVFGRGYDDIRGNSGYGNKESDVHNIVAEYCAIDITGRYVWIVGGMYINKFDTETWASVPHSIPRSPIYHPCNVENNYGVVMPSNTRVIVFDLTSGEIIKDITTENPFTSSTGNQDCILVDDVIYLTNIANQQSAINVTKISLTDDTVTSMVMSGLYNCGFADDDLIYGYWAKVWFSQVSRAYAWDLNLTEQWQIVEPSTSVSFASNLHGLCGNGYLYLPTPDNGTWGLGEYDAHSAPDLVTPAPIRVFGEFESRPQFQPYYCYNQGKTKAAFQTSIGTYYTDFSSIERLDDDETPNLRPLAMNDEFIISSFDAGRKIIVQYI